MRRVVVTGLGTVNPIGRNVNETFEAIMNKKCGIRPITSFDTTDYKAKNAGIVDNIDFEEFIEPKRAKNNERFINFGLIAAEEAVKQANLDIESIDSDRFGVLFTSGIGGLNSIEESTLSLKEKGVKGVSAHFIPKSLTNLSAGQIAIKYQAKGYVSSVVTACAASTNAIGDAFLRIAYDFEDVMIAGGAEAAITPLGIAGFQSIRALSTNEDPLTCSTPFDKNRSGFVMGEGAGVVVLEEYEHAKARGAKIIAEVVGYGVSCDAFHATSPVLDGSSAAKAMNKAIKQANIKPSEIKCYNAHGTSTKLNDETEANAIKLVFNENPKDVYVTSLKGNIGHLLGAAGGVEAVATIKCMQENIIPATINVKEVDDLGINVAVENIKKEYSYAMSNSLGFGGHNACLIFKKIEN